MAKVRREIRQGMNELKNVWDAKITQHMEEIEMQAKQRNPLLGATPHLIILVFAIFLVWTAQPGSSEIEIHLVLFLRRRIPKKLSQQLKLVEPLFCDYNCTKLRGQTAV